MNLRRALCRRNFRTFILVLCVFYLILIFTFHGTLQPEPPHRTHNFAEEDKDIAVHFNDGGVWDNKKDVFNVRHDLNPEQFEMNQNVRDNIFDANVEDFRVGNEGAMGWDPPCDGTRRGDAYSFQELISDLFVYSVYWDNRPNDFDNQGRGNYLRIMTLIHSRLAHQKRAVYCHFYEQGSNSFLTSVQATYYEMCENHAARYGGFILSCKVPFSIEKAPCSVKISINEQPSEEAKSFRVQNVALRDERHKFSMCVSPLYGDINIPKLTEWIELSQLLGAEHVTFYDADLNIKTRSLLEYYRKKGTVTIIPWKLPDVVGKHIWYNGQLIAIQDCLYRNMGKADFVAFNDIDEFMVPRNGKTWSDMVEQLYNDQRCGFQLSSAFFDPNRQDLYQGNETMGSLFTFTDYKRSEAISRIRTKCMIKPHLVFESGIHHISKPIYANLETYRPDTSQEVLLHHYRTCMANYGMTCDKFVDDKTVEDHFGSALYQKVSQTINSLGQRYYDESPFLKNTNVKFKPDPREM